MNERVKMLQRQFFVLDDFTMIKTHTWVID